jgi:hypothetical protein
MENLITQAPPPNGETVAADLEMRGRDIEACRRLRASILSLPTRQTGQLSRFLRSNLLLEMLDQVVGATQVTRTDS